MKLIFILFVSLFLENICITTFSDMINNLRILESYISEYKKETNSKKTLTNLVVSYIREGKYKDIYWQVAAGSAPKDLADYITKKDKEHGTNSAQCRKYGDIVMPSGEKSDFIHLFAVINGLEFCDSYTEGVSALVGWGGDTSQLIQDLKKYNGDMNKLYIEATKFFGIKGQFGEADLIADLDGPIFLNKKNDQNTFADIIEKYYNEGEYMNRVRDFVKLTFPELNEKSNKDQFRKIIYDRYVKDTFLKILELKYAVHTGYDNHRFAAVYIFADYLYKNYKK